MHRANNLLCPACQVPLAGSKARHDCRQCDGVWLRPLEFWRAFREAQPQSPIEELMLFDDGAAKRPCPACNSPMDLAWIDMLPLEQCGSHGIWFDTGELDRALALDTGAKQLIQISRRGEERRRNRGKKRQ